MKKILKIIWFYIRYVLYFMFTLNRRTEYIQAKGEGMHCKGSYDSSWFFYGSETTYVFDPNKPPTRRYVTFKEYKETEYPK